MVPNGCCVDAVAMASSSGPPSKRINAWALEPLGGKLREVRTLLVTLHSVLWEGSGWEPLGLDKVVVAARVRLHFMRACTKVHPD